MPVTASVVVAELPDSVLIHRFLDGDEGAFRTLYHRHTPRLRMVLWRLLGQNDTEVDDVVQETWFKGCRGIHGFNGDSKFATWLTSIGIRTVYSRYSKNGDSHEQLFDDIPEAEPAEPGNAIDLERALALLPKHQRMVVVLHDIEGFTHQEIARQLGVASGTSKATLSRARCALRRLLNGGLAHAK